MGRVMRRIRCGNARGLVYILAPGEALIPGEICFTAAEYTYAERYVGGLRETSEKQDFWQGIFDAKLANNRYSVFDAFPVVSATEAAPRPAREEPPGAGPEVAKKYIGAILTDLRGRSQNAG